MTIKICQSRRTIIDTLVFTPLVIIFFIKIHLIPVGEAVPLAPLTQGFGLEDVGNNSLTVSSGPPIGCRYQGSVYSAGEEVPTEEPCLLCACKTSAVVCKLRICPEISVPPPPGCIRLHRAKKCCAELVCHFGNFETNRKFSREHRLPALNSSLATTSAEGTKGFCVLDGTVYAEGSAMRPRNPSLCQYCFCIRGEMRCSSPKCVIPLNGCKPKFRSYACCPTNYDCVESNTTAIVKTTPSSTPTPEFLKGCLVNGKRVAEGEPVLPLQLENQTNSCQTCFCMGGVIHCAQLECDKAIEGCRPILEPGHCCPDRYDCDNNFKESSTTTTTTTTTTANILLVSTTERPEPLPQPASQKLKSTTDDDSVTNVGATSTEVKVSGSGSREDRRNKSYEEDEKEDSSSISFEHGENDPNSMSFEDSTDHSASNSEETSDIEISPTEENNVEIETTDSSVVSEQPISETLEARIVSTRNPSTSSVSTVHEVTTILPTTSVANSSPVITNSTTTTTTTTTEESSTVDDSFLRVDEGSTTDIPPSSIRDLPESSTDTVMEFSTVSIINQDESLTKVPSTLATLTRTTSTSRPVQMMMETTVKNVHFIPFGVEDAVISPINDTNPLPGSQPLNLAYDSHALKISLIPPSSTPLKGFERVPLHHQIAKGAISGAAQSQQQTAALPNTSTLSVEPVGSSMTVLRGGSGGSKDDLRNAIMDVPVSTSLYSNGFYRNGIITEDSQRAPLELEITSSRRPFPGQVFEEDDDAHSFKLGIQDAILPPPSNKKIFDSTPPSSPLPTLSNNNPARTYSKFGIQDSTYYRYGYRNTNGPTPASSTISPTPQVVTQQQQQHHHRYYNAPEHSLQPQNPYYAVLNEDEELTYDEEEGQSFEEQSVEDLHNHFTFNHQKPISSSNPPPTTTPPVYVLAQSSNNNDHMTITPSTKSPSSVSLLKISGYSNSSNSRNRIGSGFTPVLAYPFNLPKRSDFNLGGLKLSGCNISGKMYNIGDVIRELSSSCVRCLCTEVGGVQCEKFTVNC